MKIALVFTLLALLVFSGCITQQVPGNQTAMPNPAAVNCADKGYGYGIRSGADGQYGICSFNGSECEEWALYRRECCLQAGDCICGAGKTAQCTNNTCSCASAETQIPNPAAVNCISKGYEIEIRTDATGGQYGICKYGSSECEEWALYRYECCLTPADCPINCAGTIECSENKCICVMQEENETGYETINKSVGEILNEQLAECDRWFYGGNPLGMLTVKTYTWTIGNETNPPDVLPIGGGYENAVRFNDETIRPIIGFALKIYTPSGGHAVSDDCAAAIFKSESTVLDTYGDFSADFNPGGFGEPIEKHLDGCTMLNKTNYISGSTTISVYRFACHSTEEE